MAKAKTIKGIKLEATIEDPCPPADDRLGYLAFFDDCEKRTKNGQTQQHCYTCKRWRWRDQLAACRRADGGARTVSNTKGESDVPGPAADASPADP